MSKDGDRLRLEAASRVEACATSVRQALQRIQPQLAGDDGPWQQWLTRVVSSPVTAQAEDIAAFRQSINAQLLCSIVSVADANDAVAMLLRGGIPVQLSALVASRTALEAAANTHHLLSQVPHDGHEFVARALEMAWQSWSAERPLVPMGQEIGMLNPGYGAHTKARLAAASAAHGWQPRFSKHKLFVNLVQPGGKARPAPASATARIAATCDQDGVHSWRITSGAAHGLPWMQVHEIVSPDQPMPGASGLTAAASALEAVRILLSTLAKPFDDIQMSRDAEHAREQKYPALPNQGCRCCLNPPASRRLRAM